MSHLPKFDEYRNRMAKFWDSAIANEQPFWGVERIARGCLHCGLAESAHAGPQRKCPFEPTNYEAFGDARALKLKQEVDTERIADVHRINDVLDALREK